MSRTEPELRKFGLVMAGALAAFTVYGLLRGRSWWLPTGGVSFSFAFLALTFPGLLAPVEWFWMKLAGVMGFVVTHVILTVFFVLVMTPAGLLMRLAGKDPLKVRCRDKDTCWEETEKDGPCSRPDKPY